MKATIFAVLLLQWICGFSQSKPTPMTLDSFSKEAAKINNTEHWQYVGDDADSKYFMWSTPIEKKDSVVRFWTKRETSKIVLKGKAYLNPSIKTIVELDIEKSRIRYIKSAFYSQDGKLIETTINSVASAQWEDVIPESVGAEYLFLAKLIYFENYKNQ